MRQRSVPFFCVSILCSLSCFLMPGLARADVKPSPAQEFALGVWLLCTVGLVVSLLVVLFLRVSRGSKAGRDALRIAGIANLLASVATIGSCHLAAPPGSLGGTVWYFLLPQPLLGLLLCACSRSPA